MHLIEAHEQEVVSGERFAFGANWSRFLALLTHERIQSAVGSLSDMLGVTTLAGKTFLDIGSGSGLFSLAARRLGAKVVSFDYDPKSVACTAELRRRFYPGDDDWRVEQGSVLDTAYLATLGQFDIVYSWGVLHHTGSMWQAVRNAEDRVRPGGTLFIALYNDQGAVSRYWTFVKRMYNKHPSTRPLWMAVHAVYPLFPSLLLKAIRRRKSPRGMNPWIDLIDWLGGYPFEVATPDQVLASCGERGFRPLRERRVGSRMGCNEFVFQRDVDVAAELPVS